MRNLTIRRIKSFVGCAMKVQVCIQDYLYGDIMINGVPCRKLGTLKSGEEKTFQITQEQTQVFVIADKLSKGYCNESFDIPEGEEDVFLSGRNHFNPLAGNPFYFEGQTSRTVLEKRKKNARKGAAVLAICVLFGGLAGLLIGGLAGKGSSKQDPKIFSKAGMEIMLTNAFREGEYEGFAAAYESKDAGVLAIREDFSMLEGLGDLTLEEYDALVLQSNAAAGMQAKTDGKNDWFEHRWTNPDTGITYYYVSTTYKAKDAFWLLQFFTTEDKAEAYLPEFLKWANTVRFPAN